MRTRIRIFSIILILSYFWFSNTQTTSADIFAERRINENTIQASTLSFSLKNTANNAPKQLLFQTTGLIPDGYDMGAIKMQKDGKMNVKYAVNYEFNNGNRNLCNTLHLRVVNKKLEEKYNGTLEQLAFQTIIPDTDRDDWIFILELQSNNQEFKNSSCSFNIVLKTYIQNPQEQPKGFHAEQTLVNNITTGTWK